MTVLHCIVVCGPVRTLFITSTIEFEKDLSHAMSKLADVTAVVLNWARLENVKIIVANLCSQDLQDIISSIIVWNNQSNITLSYAVSSVALAFASVPQIASLMRQ